MWRHVPRGWILLLSLMAFGALASERRSVIRNVVLAESLTDSAQSIYVAGKVATVLRFETPCDPARTKLLGWEGRFEPLLVSGRSVVLVPLQDLALEDRFLLLVTLMDGTELPFTVRAGENEVDHQVNLFPDSGTLEAVRASLDNALSRERTLQEEANRYREEKTSVDHALAALLVKGELGLTPFRHIRTWALPSDGARVEVRSYSGPDKTAIVFRVTNRDRARPWKLMEARLSTVSTSEARPFALRADVEEIAPGATGTLAVVADGSAFESKSNSRKAEKLVLELFRSDGLRQVCVLLEVEQQGRRE